MKVYSQFQKQVDRLVRMKTESKKERSKKEDYAEWENHKIGKKSNGEKIRRG
jgi:hypothetical protein